MKLFIDPSGIIISRRLETTEACVIGDIMIGGVVYTFFGCDVITVKP